MTQHNWDEDLSRRSALQVSGGLTALFSSALILPWSKAHAESGEIFTPPGLQRDLAPDAGKHPRARIDARYPFDLDDPISFLHAKFKAQYNLVGATSYVSIRTRHHLCRDGIPSEPFVDELELWTIYIEQPADAKDPVMRAMFTRCFLDPESDRRMESFLNGKSSERIPLPYQLFSISSPVKFQPTGQVGAQTTATVREFDRRPNRFGHYIDFVNLAVRQKDGPHQPSLDTSTWRVSYERLMDPQSPTITAHYSFSALARASLYGWSGYAANDAPQIFSTKAGLKVHDTKDLPDLVKDLLISKFPNRV
ncbi:MAG: hypothetical protein SFV19_04220 [Rhodospirillaceae bacterium]|nr:hypothetical protein [Rhodospirillaceae bacterium]